MDANEHSPSGGNRRMGVVFQRLSYIGMPAGNVDIFCNRDIA